MSQSLTLVGARDRELPAILDRPGGSRPVRGGVVLAHGAGGTSRTPFLARAAEGIAAAGWAVLRFDFGYAVAGGRPGRADREDGPERADYRAALDALADALPAGTPLVAAGKSYGGRVATFVLAGGREDPLVRRVGGLLVLGYPIAPPSGARPADVDALHAVAVPVLIVQGSRDSLGPLPALHAALQGVDGATIAVIEGGDHSYRAPGGAAVVTRLADEAIAAAVRWLAGLV